MIAINDLAAIRARHDGDTIVLTSGTYDLLHVGHLHYLQAVKTYGDIVVVLLSSDRRVKSRKGEDRPVIPENDRAEMLEALEVVDYVLLDPDKDELRAEIIAKLQPNFYVTDGLDPRFVDLVDRLKFVILPREKGGQHASTSAIIERLSSSNSH